MERRVNGNRAGEEQMKYSPQSILSAMDKFNSAVGAMHNSVLVPCRLQDLNDPDMGDLHAAYKLLSKTKMDLLFGDDSKKLSMKNGRMSRSPSGLPKSPSNATVISSNASSASLGDQADQNIPPVDPSLGNVDPTMLILHASLNQNLKNMYDILEQMTDAANRVTSLYLKEIGS